LYAVVKRCFASFAAFWQCVCGTIARMPTPAPSLATAFGPADLAELERLLDAVPAPLEPLDPVMLDGFLCGVLLLPQRIPPAQWLPHLTDVDQARALPRSYPAQALHDLVAQRFQELDQAIEQRQWFDPWVFEPDEEEEQNPLETVMPWVAGFATAVDLFPSVLQSSDERVLEGQALLYRAFNPDDLEDADALLEVMAELEPPEDLGEVVEDLVTAVFLLADVTRPLSAEQLARQDAEATPELAAQIAPSRAPRASAAAANTQPTRSAAPAAGRPGAPASASASTSAPARPGPGRAGPGKNAAGKIGANKPKLGASAAAKSAKPAGQAAGQAGAGKPGARPGASKPGTHKPGVSKPGVGKPGVNKPGAGSAAAGAKPARPGGGKPPRSGTH